MLGENEADVTPWKRSFLLECTLLLCRVLRSVTRANWRLGDGARGIPTGPSAGLTLLT